MVDLRGLSALIRLPQDWSMSDHPQLLWAVPELKHWSFSPGLMSWNAACHKTVVVVSTCILLVK